MSCYYLVSSHVVSASNNCESFIYIYTYIYIYIFIYTYIYIYIYNIYIYNTVSVESKNNSVWSLKRLELPLKIPMQRQ